MLPNQPSPLNHFAQKAVRAMRVSNSDLKRSCWKDPHKHWTRSELERRKAEYYKREFGFDYYGGYDHDVYNRAAGVATGLRNRGACDYFLQTIDVRVYKMAIRAGIPKLQRGDLLSVPLRSGVT